MLSVKHHVLCTLGGAPKFFLTFSWAPCSEGASSPKKKMTFFFCILYNKTDSATLE